MSFAEVPEWVNAEFFEKVLRKSEGDETIKVTKVVTSRATAVGDNYLSDMIRAAIEYSSDDSNEKNISLVVKIAPIAEGNCKELVKIFNAFETEIEMMERTLAKMNELLNEPGYRLSARVLYSEIGQPSLLVLEDLKAHGYQMADRQSRLDLQQSMLTLRALAKFHASSIALHEREPKALERYQRGLYRDNVPDHVKDIFKNGLEILGNQVREWTELGTSRDIYSEKLLKLSEVAYDKAFQICTATNGQFLVLNHGDVWVNNMMFLYDDDNRVVDHIFVDFQMCSWQSPVVDIWRFTATSIDEDTEVNHLDALHREYLRVLTETMTRLDCKRKPPTWEEFEKMMQDYAYMDVMWTAVGLPFIMLDKDEALTFDELMKKKPGNTSSQHKNPSLRRIMVRRLKDWDARGTLDL